MNQNSQRTPPHHLTRMMNSECFFCPTGGGCSHSPAGNNRPFTTHTTLLRHLNSSTHASTHHLANHAICANAGISTCCHCSCPAKPNIFFSSSRAYNVHCPTAHHPPPPPTTAHTETPSTPFTITTQFLHLSSIMPTTSNHWLHGLAFISTMYSHEPPDFRTTWHHFLQSRNKSAFCNLQAAIIQARSLPPPPTAPTLMTRPHFYGSSYILTCLSLLLRLGNNATTPQYKKKSAIISTPPSPVTLHTYIIPQCKSVDSPRIPALPHLPATALRNAPPITTTTVQQFRLTALHNLSLLLAPPISPLSTNCTHNLFRHATIHPHPPHLHTNPTPSLVTSATLSFTLPRTKAPVSTLTRLTSSSPLSKVK
jgi:hypothetical protein